eukprot:5068911-Pleurochrysis_carterae.AAC.1
MNSSDVPSASSEQRVIQELNTSLNIPPIEEPWTRLFFAQTPRTVMGRPSRTRSHNRPPIEAHCIPAVRARR